MKEQLGQDILFQGHLISSYSTVVIVGVGKKSYGFTDFHTLENDLAISFIQKSP